MANRKILYGYQIIHGDLVIQEEERLTVQNIFTTYLAGLSYQALADRMNADNIPFSQESPLWNKHKIKRMLENSRYAGGNGYPPIIDQDTFQQVQEKISEKTSGKFPRRTESDGLWQKLRSGCCQTRLLRTGGPIGHTAVRYTRRATLPSARPCSCPCSSMIPCPRSTRTGWTWPATCSGAPVCWWCAAIF